MEMVARTGSSALTIRMINMFGIAFDPDDDVLDQFQEEGANDALLATLLGAGPPRLKKPLGETDILSLVAKGTLEGSIIKSIKRRGIDFQPAGDYLSELASKGAQKALLDELRSTAPRPFSMDEMAQALSAQRDVRQLGQEIQERGIDFEPTEENLAALRAGGAPDALLQAVRMAKRSQPFVPYFVPLDHPNRLQANAPTFPHPVYKPEPPYTPEASRAGVEGSVDLRILVDEHGKVAEISETSRPLGYGLDEIAIQTVKTWTFEPATSKGVPVSARIRVSITFCIARPRSKTSNSSKEW